MMESPDKIVQGWKDISSYLSDGLNVTCAVRTAQDWEQREGLPVRRSGSRVWAHSSDLDEFIKRKISAPKLLQGAEFPDRIEGNKNHTPEAIGAVNGEASMLSTDRSTTHLAWSLLPIFVFATLTWILWPTSYTLTAYSVEGMQLRVQDASGKTQWAYDLPSEPLPMSYENPGSDAQYIRGGRFLDLDGDGKKEFLFVFHPAGTSDVLYLFHNDGKLGWKTTVGSDVSNESGSTILNYYRIRDVGLISHTKSGQSQIAILAHHNASYPSVVTILTTSGVRMANYWHAGWLFTMDFVDLDSDGRDEIVLGGLSNSFGDTGQGPILLVLDSGQVTGQGPTRSGDSRRFVGLDQGHEAAALLFPDLPLLPAYPNGFSWVSHVSFVDKHLEVEVRNTGNVTPGPRAHYQLDRKLRMMSVTPNVFVNSLLSLSPRDVRQRLAMIRTLQNRFD